MLLSVTIQCATFFNFELIFICEGKLSFVSKTSTLIQNLGKVEICQKSGFQLRTANLNLDSGCTAAQNDAILGRFYARNSRSCEFQVCKFHFVKDERFEV